MHERIKQVRESLKDSSGRKMSQAKFAEQMNVTRDMIATYEIGRVEPTPLFISTLCDRFGISEEWLRTGEGEMMRPLEREEEIAKLANKMLDEVEPSIRNAFIRAVMATNNETLQALKDFSETFIHELNNPPTK